MSTLVYSPGITARIQTHPDSKGKGQVIDITEDLVQGVLTIRTEAVHTFNFQLQNTQRKYDGVIQPMDKIIVEMKRITPVKVFSGYLNNGPIFSVWPRVLDLSASCTMKRLQFWYWDPTAPKSQAMLAENLHQGLQTDTGSTPGGPAPVTPDVTTQQQATSSDSNIKDLVIKLLVDVVGWPQEHIHIAAVPQQWYAFAGKVAELIHQSADESKFIGDLSSDGGIFGGAPVSGSSPSGPGGAVNGALQPGTYCNMNIDGEQAGNVSVIWRVSHQRNMGSDNVVTAMIEAGITESTLRNLDHGAGSSVGLFQLIDSHGTKAQRMDPTFSCNWWLDQAAGIPNRDTMPPGQLAQAVERSAYPDRYAKNECPAKAMLDALKRSESAKTAAQSANAAQSGIGTPPVRLAGGTHHGPVNTAQVGLRAPAPGPAGSLAPPPAPATGNTGRNLARVAHDLITSHEPGHIRYQLGGDDPATSADPRVLDCSSLVDWCYFHATGRTLAGGGGRTDTNAEIRMSMPLDLGAAQATKGALLFIGTTHVGISLGNGNHVAAHTDGIPLPKQVDISPNGGQFNHAALAPGLNYADAATNPQAAAALQRVVGYPTTVSDPNEFGGGSPISGTGAPGGGGAAGTTADASSAVFNELINVYSWGFQPATDGQFLMGPRALMNDQPMFPYINNLLKASMRSFCAAPNGDFMAWFPDYFGIWGGAAKMNVRPIELMDFTVMWSDQHIVTHQYVVGLPVGTGNASGGAANFDSATGTFGAPDNMLFWRISTQGIATMDFPEIFQAIFGEDASADFIAKYLSRFGGRPDLVTMPVIPAGRAEFFMALYLFMQRWAAQFEASVPMTFMPELWPGMLLVLPDYSFQAYITEVQHTFRFGPGGGFSTQASIVAPARTGGTKSDILGLLPLGGKRYLNGAPANAPQPAPNPTPPPSRLPPSRGPF